MAIHEDISAESQLHAPKGFTPANANTYLSKNENEGLEWFQRERLPKAIDLVSSIAAPPTEVTGDIYLIGNESGTLDVDTITFQSGTTIRYTFNGTPDLSGYGVGDYFFFASSTNVINDGVFQATAVNDGSDYVEITNGNRTDGTDDEATDSPCTSTITLIGWGGAPQNSWVRYDSLNWNSIVPLVGFLSYLTTTTLDYSFDGTDWVSSSSPSDGNGMFSASNDAGTWGVTAYSLGGDTTITQAANTIAYTASAVNAFSIDGNTFSVDATNGRIGIRTLAPTNALEIVGGNARIGGELYINNSGGNGADLQVNSDISLGAVTTTNGFTFAIKAGASNGLVIGNSGDFSVGADRRIYLRNQAGNGANILMYNGAGGQDINLTTEPNGIIVFNETSRADLDFRIKGDTDSSLIKVDASADAVGFGVAFPTEKVDVLGNITVSGSYHVDGTQVVSDQVTGWTDQTAAAARVDLGASPTVGALASAFRALYDDLKSHGLIAN